MVKRRTIPYRINGQEYRIDPEDGPDIDWPAITAIILLVAPFVISAIVHIAGKGQ